MNFSESTMLITGASGNLGGALARHFAPKCGHLVLTGRDSERLGLVANDVRERGGVASTVVADFLEIEGVRKIEDAVNAHESGLDVLIHNAADVTSKSLRNTPDDEIMSLLRTNAIVPLQLTRALLPAMDRSARKRIVWISSLAGYKPNPAQTVYSISKSAVNASATALRAELGGDGYRVLNVPLSTVHFDSSGGSISEHAVCAKIEGAIASGQTELFLSPLSRMLMRFYGMFPGAARR